MVLFPARTEDLAILAIIVKISSVAEYCHVADFRHPQKLAISLILAVSLKTFSRKELAFLESCITSSGTIGVRSVFERCSKGVQSVFVGGSIRVRSGINRFEI